ncbi:sporulation protein rmd1 [Basidiobolus ranarum]|uniref:Sporulation protein rmd1 n=1 Tax=Basidiobolus ranarum TaxID=34480 RepID=A0ABR2X1K9_9FUNG
MTRRRSEASSLPTQKPPAIQQKVVFPQSGTDFETEGFGHKSKLPNRTTKTSQKLALFPEAEQDVHLLPGDFTENEYYSTIKHLPRVSAYCTASSYRMDSLMKHFQSLKRRYLSTPKRFDECIYSPFSFHAESINGTVPTGDLLSLSAGDTTTNVDHSFHQYEENELNSFVMGEIFLFDYGVCVLWGFTEKEETKILEEIAPFEKEKLDITDVESEQLHFRYNSSAKPNIFNDIITLKNPSNYMVKLTISHAIAQSVKMTLFEELVDATIATTKYIPQDIAQSGKVNMSRTAITKKIGQLFIMRINVNLVSNILDTPEIFWSEPSLKPLYKTIRGYLEIGQRVDLLNQRVSVIGDLLEMLKDHLNSSHSEQLEWIIIILLVFEIIIGLSTIGFDIANFKQGTGMIH